MMIRFIARPPSASGNAGRGNWPNAIFAATPLEGNELAAAKGRDLMAPSPPGAEGIRALSQSVKAGSLQGQSAFARFGAGPVHVI
jgi:hypothetical protein